MRSRLNLPIVLFGILLALCLVTVIAFVTEETPYEDVPAPGGGVQRVRAGHGVTHPAFASMDQGGSGAERHAPILWLAWTFGLLQRALIAGALLRGRARAGRARYQLAACGVLLGILFTMMVVAYRGYLETAAPLPFLALPTPTAWFLYGFWPAQFLVVALYARVFRRAVLTGEQSARFRAILAEARRRQD
ncbi:MAG: hypothetical protein OXQ28_14495 [Acidobacteriota bacterium]|nr:hypothetical protein [Acidobacteriota bacterium]